MRKEPAETALPEAFLARVRAQLGDAEEYPAFLETLRAAAPPVSVRRNPLKPPGAFPGAEPVPWCPEGVYLPERPVFARDPLWHAGAYYVQEAASMLTDAALRHFAAPLPGPIRALDLCAAPGGKSTLLTAFLDARRDGSLLMANEVIRSRVRVLRENLTRWGSPNVAVTGHDPERFATLADFFDLVLVDAPCSGEGLFRRDPEAAGEWSEANAALCAARQRRVLAAALPLVRPGGFLFYSTCTFNPAENDEAVAWMLGRQGGEWEVLPFPTPPPAWGVAATEYGVQCWPHRCRGEGFYLSVLRRQGETDGSGSTPPASFRGLAPLTKDRAATVAPYLAAPDEFALFAAPDGTVVALPGARVSDLARVAAALPGTSLGLTVGQFKGRGSDFVPAHDLALSTAHRPNLPAVPLSLDDARRYLRKDPLDLPPDTPPGWTLALYEGHALGWLKVLPGRAANNYLPADWRLRLAP